jgi:hypothetical protein
VNHGKGNSVRIRESFVSKAKETEKEMIKRKETIKREREQFMQKVGAVQRQPGRSPAIRTVPVRMSAGRAAVLTESCRLREATAVGGRRFGGVDGGGGGNRGVGSLADGADREVVEPIAR